MKSTLGALEITTKQAEKLEVLPGGQIRPLHLDCYAAITNAMAH